jgi:hypothetical protein
VSAEPVRERCRLIRRPVPGPGELDIFFVLKAGEMVEIKTGDFTRARNREPEFAAHP